MEYEEFKKEVLGKLREICGDDLQIRSGKILKNNGKQYDGIQLFADMADGKACPVIPLQWFCGAYCDGDISITGCAKVIYEMSEEYRDVGGISEMVQKIRDWEQIKERIYPILLSTEDNQEMLEWAVSIPMLDLSVAYIFRGKIDRQWAGVKISYQMLEAYGISAEELHRQALENLAADGYHFWNMNDFAASIGYCIPDTKERKKGEGAYILTNAMNFYGAAGILDRELVREFADGRNFYILPSSIHETIFAFAEEGSDMEVYNCMVKMVNRVELDVEDRLSDHAYFYDAERDEIRMCA